MADPVEHPTSAHEHARRLGALGLRVLPIKPGHKRPPMASWQHAATDDATSIDNWYTGLYRTAGVGLALGPQPCGRYLFAIDVDTHDPAHNGWDALTDLEAEHGALPDTWRSLTGAGGGHLIFAVPAGVTVRNQQASGNRIAAGIDVRGDGGQIVVAPTVHPDTQRTYEWEAGYAPWERDVAEAPAWLVELVREPEAAPVAIERPSNASPTNTKSDSQSIAADVRQWWDWHHELTARGWTLDRTSGADSYWVRPGKDRRQGHSAVLHGSDVLVVFTTEIPDDWRHAGVRTVDGSGYSFSPFGFVAAVDHRGDRSAAARALRAASTAHQGGPAGAHGAHVAQEGVVEPTEDDYDADWEPRDVATIYAGLLDGTFLPEQPEHLHVDGAMPLLYPGRVHSIFGEPGGGKTWIAYVAVAERLVAGDEVLFIDWEDSARGAAQRLVQLGVTAEQLERFEYRSPSSGLPIGWRHLEPHITRWALVVIDSTGESMAASGIDPNADGQVAAWVAYAKMLARGGATVLLVDHVAKNVENREMEIGSQRKQAAITGASYRCDTVISPAKGRDGRLKLVTRKDRLGNRPKGATAAEVEIRDTAGGGVEITLSVPESATSVDGKFRPTHLMERISRWLELHPGATQNTIRKEVSGNAKAKVSALDCLVDEGWVRVDREGQAHVHFVVREFREGLIEPVDNSEFDATAPTAPNRAHTAPTDSVGAAESNRAHRAPALLESGARGAVQGSEESVDRDHAGAVVDNSEFLI